MKKILTFISAAALLVACNDIYGPTEAPTPEVKSDGISIAVSEVKDSSVTFTLTPKSESAYYSYLVDQSAEVEKIDSSKLYSMSYKSVSQGIVKYADESSKTITVKGLAPNTPYVIYAVAGSTTGIPSKVAAETFKTSDKVAPKVAKASAKDSTVVLTYNEAIVMGSGEVTVKYYAINTSNIDKGTPEGEVKAEVEVKGADVTISFDVPKGAYYSIDVAAGAVKDLAGNDCAPIFSALAYDSEEGDVVGSGVYGQRDLGSFTIGDADQEMLTSASSPVTADLGADYGYGYTNKKAEVYLSYGNDSKVTSFLLTAGSDYGYSSKSGKLMFFLPEEPVRGNAVAIEVPEGAFEDIYGNPNEAWEAELLYAYEYTEETVIGTYTSAYKSAYGSEYNGGGTDVIAKSDDETKGNIMITSFCGETLEKPIYANWNPQTGEITIPALSYCYSYTDEGVDYDTYLSWANSNGAYSAKKAIVLQMPKAGTIQNTEWFGFLACVGSKPAGWDNVASSYVAVKSDGGSSSSAVKSALVRKPLSTLVKEEK